MINVLKKNNFFKNLNYNSYQFLWVYSIIFFNKIYFNYLSNILTIFNLNFYFSSAFFLLKILPKSTQVSNLNIKSRYLIIYGSNFNRMYIFFDYIYIKQFSIFNKMITFFFLKNLNNVFILNKFYLKWLFLFLKKKYIYKISIQNQLKKNIIILYSILNYMFCFFKFFFHVIFDVIFFKKSIKF